ncbi:hypothetical protein FACS1894167_03640 [Synergistales bacterium]|nr:hypothetical protein FACS1894167_03640 [Synergistales bacterium]
MRNRRLFIFVFIFVLLIGLGNTLYAAEDASPQDERNLISAARSMRSSGMVQFNFKDLGIIEFIRFMSELLGENIVVNPTVKGTVSVVSPKPVTLKEARQVMLSVLEMNGLSLQGMGGFSKVVPINAGPSSDNQVVKGEMSVTPSEQMIVQIVPLKYVKPAYVMDLVKATVQGVNISPIASGSVLLSGKGVLLSRAVTIIRALDAADSIRAIKTITMKYTSAKLVEGHLNGIAKDVSSKLGGLIAIGDERSRTMILVGSRQALLESERLIASLDVPATADNFHIYRLKNADAKTVAERLSQVLSIAARMQPDQKGVLPTSVVPDLPSNSLILTVPMEQYGAIKNIIDEMDTRPRQVLLRGLIAEVNLSKLASAGIDWSVWGGTAEGNALIGGQAVLGDTSVPMEFMQWFREITSKQDTYTAASGAITTTTNTQGMGLIYSYIKMLSSFHSLNVLSMPRLMCTDNLPSEMQVGYVIPQITGKTSEVSNPSATQSSYQYKDIGLILNVTPHIRSGNLVALDIEQIVEEPVGTNADSAPTTNKRRIKTNVIVGDNQTIILGGLIREAERTLKNRVPGLSYIPLVGNLFKSNGRDREKMELMVFLTPLILETPEAATQATIEATTGNKMSVGEANTLELNKDQFDKANKVEGVPKEMMITKSDDIKSAAPDNDAETNTAVSGDQSSAQN